MLPEVDMQNGPKNLINDSKSNWKSNLKSNWKLQLQAKKVIKLHFNYFGKKVISFII